MFYIFEKACFGNEFKLFLWLCYIGFALYLTVHTRTFYYHFKYVYLQMWLQGSKNFPINFIYVLREMTRQSNEHTLTTVEGSSFLGLTK